MIFLCVFSNPFSSGLMANAKKWLAPQYSLAITLLIVFFLAGCSQKSNVVFDYQADLDGAVNVWPASPEKARYRYFGQLTGEENLHSPKQASASVAIKFFRWLVGLGEQTHDPLILQRPQAGVVAEDGRIFVSDVSRQAIYVFDPIQASLNLWEYAEKGLKFELPIGIAIAENNSVLVTDASLAVVAKLTASGEPMYIFGKEELKHPAGIARDPKNGQVYVADRKDNAIKVFSSVGDFLFLFGGFGEAEGLLNGPTHLVWGDDSLYVTDTLNSRVQVFSPTGKFLSTFGQRGLYVGDLPRPKGVALDSEGNVYVIESYYDHLLIFDSDGQFLLPIGGSGYEIGQFFLPAGIWIDTNDRIYVADMFNGRVVIFEYLGEEDESDVEE